MVEYLCGLQFVTIINNATVNIPGYIDIFLHTLGGVLRATHPGVELLGKVRVLFYRGHPSGRPESKSDSASSNPCHSENITSAP